MCKILYAPSVFTHWKSNDLNVYILMASKIIYACPSLNIDCCNYVNLLFKSKRFGWSRVKWFIWVRSRRCGCLVTWFCYQLIAKPGNKTATVSWPDPYSPNIYIILTCTRVQMLWEPSVAVFPNALRTYICHYTNFAVTGCTRGCGYGNHHGDEKVGIMIILGFQFV